MSQENTSLEQGILIDQLQSIAKWMREYEQHQYEEANKIQILAGKIPKELDERFMTQELKNTGYCFGLSAYLIHCVITEDRIYKQRQKNILEGNDTNDGFPNTPLTIDEFYTKLRYVNSLQLSSSYEGKKELYQELQLFLLEIIQLQSMTDRRINDKPYPQNMLSILNESAPLNVHMSDYSKHESDVIKVIHTYFFTEVHKLIEWAVKAEPGDALSISTMAHRIAVYAKRSHAGENIIGLYDANNSEIIEIPQYYLSLLYEHPYLSTIVDRYGKVIKFACGFINKKYFNLNLYETVRLYFDSLYDEVYHNNKTTIFMCEHIVAMDNIRPIIQIENNILHKLALDRLRVPAAAHCRGEVIEHLIALGVDININPLDWYSPLQEASFWGNVEGVQTLLSANAKVDIITPSGETPLIIAAEVGHAEIVRLLIQYGANIDARDKCNVTALHIAIWNGHTEVAQALINSGAQLDIIDSNRNTPLRVAANTGNIDIVLALIKYGANIDARNDYNSTALHIAICNGHTEVAQALINSGAQLDIKNHEGATSLMYAVQKGAIELIKLLIKVGADPTLTSQDGFTIWDFASNDVEVLNLLDELIEGNLQYYFEPLTDIFNDKDFNDKNEIYYTPCTSPLIGTTVISE